MAIPEVSPRNKRFSAISSREGMTRDDASTQIHPLNLPHVPNEVVVTKLRVSAFTGSDLEVVLRAKQVETLGVDGNCDQRRGAVDLCGKLRIRTSAWSCCPMPCMDADPEVHRVLIGRIFPRQAEVITVDAWAESLKGKA